MYQTIILNTPNITDWSKERNKALKTAKSDWVFFLDSDEEVSPELTHELNSPQTGFNGFYLRRDDYFMGRWLKFGETANARLLRLAKKDAGVWHGKVHETWDIKGPVGELKNHLRHYPHKNIAGFITKINHYTDLAAAQRFSHSQLFLPIGKFFQNYFLRLGFLDGMAGFVVAYMMSFHSLLVRVKSYDLSRTT